MKKKTVVLPAIVLVVLAMLAVAVPAMSQPPMPPALEQLRQDAGGEVEITWNPLTGTPSFILGRIPLPAIGLDSQTKPSTTAITFVDRYASLLGLKQASSELRVIQDEVDALGMRHVTLIQVYQGIEVYEASVKVHLSTDGQEIVAASSGFVPDIQVPDTQPRISAEQALAAAQKALPNGVLLSGPKPVVYPGRGERPGASAKLAWLVELRDDSIPARNVYVVDAIEGSIIDVLDRLYRESTPYSTTIYNRIGIEAGHGGSDPGSMSCDGQRKEADNTIAVANLAAGILRSRGYTVDIFRGGDTSMQGYLADAFISLHNDWCAPGARGFKVSRYGGAPGTGVNGSGDASDRLVQTIWIRYEQVTGMVRDTEPGHFPDRMRFYYALDWIDDRTPGAIIEMGWWSGDEDMLLNQRGVLAAGVAESIAAFLGRTDSDDARTITSPQTLIGTIEPANDVDTYYFDASTGQRATIQMTKSNSTPSLDPYLILYAPDGREITRDDDSGGDRNALINQVSLPQTGRYRIEAKSYAGSSTGSYSLSLNLHQPGQPDRKTYDAQHGYTLPGTLARSEGQGPIGDRDVDNAHDFAGDTYNYYWNMHGRDSYDNRGARLVSTANYGRSYQNAYWNGEQTVYGDYFPVKDTVAHEWTHAVTEHSANLEYHWQSGALNESFSDIFGAMVDRDDWLMGEDLPPHILGGREAIRDLSNPPRFSQPDHTDDWVETCSDNEGVHTNSGITNKAYYNIATAIGKDKAERIFYRALTVYLDANSSLEDARAAALQSAQDLYGANSPEYNAVRDGFNAVGLDGQWNPPPNDCTCAATTALSDKAVYSDQVSALEVAATLYRVRDQLLNGTAAGEHYRKLYEQHTGRISWLLLLNPGLRATGGQILKAVTPGLNHLMEGQGGQDIVTQELVDDVLSFLQRLAEEGRAEGGDELADTIERERARIDWGRLVGMTYEEAWQYIQSRVAAPPFVIYLPVVSR